MRIIVSLLFLFWCCACQEGEPVGISINQSFSITSKDSDMPVSLSGNEKSNTIIVAIQGGARGAAIDVLRYYYRTTLENQFLLAYWDQRYVGFSTNRNVPNDVDLSLFAEDASLVINELKARYPRKKIVLLGQGWGGWIVSQFITDNAYQNLYDGWIIQNGTTTNGFERWQYLRLDLIARAQARANAGSAAWADSLRWMNAQSFNTSVINRALTRRYTALIRPLWEEEPVPADVGFSTQAPPYFTFSDKARAQANARLRINTTVIPDKLYFFNRDANIPNITKKGLLIWGGLDSNDPLSYARAFKEKLGDKAMLIAYDDTGSQAYATHLARFSSDVSNFITTLP
jgi:pimeloyl-ACP methyl ester carboxylesterase